MRRNGPHSQSQMSNPIAIVIGSALIAGAILVTGHWQITSAPNTVFRLNRWSGEVVSCNLTPAQFDKGNWILGLGGVDLPCVLERETFHPVQ